MNAQDLVDLYERCEAAERTLRHLGYSYVQGAEFWKPPVRNNHKWLQENTLIYRLTDDVRPVNCDEINVTMADGSRSMEKRTERAAEILNLLQGVSRVTVENPLGLKKFSALEFINTDEELDAYVAEQVDEAIKAHTAGAATPAAPAPDYEAGCKDGYKHGAWSTQQPAPATQQAGSAEVIECGNLYAKVKLKGEAFGSTRVGDTFYAAPQPPTTAQAAESVPAIQGEVNVQLDTDSNSSASEQQRNVAGSVAMGQLLGNGQDQAAGHTGAQGDKLLTVAERNIRSFLRSAQFKSESDREAALNCVDVLWAAARDPADSVREDAARWRFVESAPSAITLRLHNLRPDQRAQYIDTALAAQQGGA